MNIEQTKEYKQLCECYNVEAKCEDEEGSGCKYSDNGRCKNNYNYGSNYNNGNCPIAKKYDYKYYPPFTPQKQLELIKLILSLREFNRFDYERGRWYKAFYINCTDITFNDLDVVNLLIELKDNLDHAKIKEILEG